MINMECRYGMGEYESHFMSLGGKYGQLVFRWWRNSVLEPIKVEFTSRGNWFMTEQSGCSLLHLQVLGSGSLVMTTFSMVEDSWVTALISTNVDLVATEALKVVKLQVGLLENLRNWWDCNSYLNHPSHLSKTTCLSSSNWFSMLGATSYQTWTGMSSLSGKHSRNVRCTNDFYYVINEPYFHDKCRWWVFVKSAGIFKYEWKVLLTPVKNAKNKKWRSLEGRILRRTSNPCCVGECEGGFVVRLALQNLKDTKVWEKQKEFMEGKKGVCKWHMISGSRCKELVYPLCSFSPVQQRLRKCIAWVVVFI